MFIIKLRRVCHSSELIKWVFISMLINLIFVVGVQGMIIENERDTIYVITVSGTMDVGHLLYCMQSKLRRKVEVVTPPLKAATPLPSQQTKKM